MYDDAFDTNATDHRKHTVNITINVQEPIGISGACHLITFQHVKSSPSEWQAVTLYRTAVFQPRQQEVETHLRTVDLMDQVLGHPATTTMITII